MAAIQRAVVSAERAMVRLAVSRPGAWLVINVLTHVDRLLVRASRGRLSTMVGTRFHPHIVLLRAIGARTGRVRDVPLLALLDGPRVILIASRGGHPRDPAWYYNLRAHPRATVMVRGQARPYLAREAEGAERIELWRRAVELYPGYAAYQTRVDRRVPVLVLEPFSSEDPDG